MIHIAFFSPNVLTLVHPFSFLPSVSATYFSVCCYLNRARFLCFSFVGNFLLLWGELNKNVGKKDSKA